MAIEDSANGIRAAAAAGMTVIAVPNRDFPPDQRIASGSPPGCCDSLARTLATSDAGLEVSRAGK